MRYFASGLLIECDRPLKGMTEWPGPERADVRVAGGEIATPTALLATSEQEGEPTGLSIGITADAFVLEFSGASFVLSRAGDVVTYAVSSPESPFSHLLLDHVVPRLLSLRGSLALHATAVRYAGRAAAFIGESGAGKSTLACALHERGAFVLADDCLRLEEREGATFAFAGYPGVRLLPDVRERYFPSSPSEECFGEKVHVGPRVSPDESPLSTSVLSRIYVLARDRTGRAPPAVCALSPARAAIELSRHTFRLGVDDPERRRREVSRVVEVVRTVRVQELAYGSSLDDMDAVARVVLDDLSEARHA